MVFLPVGDFFVCRATGGNFRAPDTDDSHELTSEPYGILKGVVDSKSFRKGSWGSEIIEELKPEPQDIVIEGKRGLDGFASTNLDFVLRSRGITNIVLGGFLTNCCVESTEKNHPMFSRPMDHTEFIAELGGTETTAGSRTGRGYTTESDGPSIEAPA